MIKIITWSSKIESCGMVGRKLSEVGASKTDVNSNGTGEVGDVLILVDGELTIQGSSRLEFAGTSFLFDNPVDSSILVKIGETESKSLTVVEISPVEPRTGDSILASRVEKFESPSKDIFGETGMEGSKVGSDLVLLGVLLLFNSNVVLLKVSGIEGMVTEGERIKLKGDAFISSAWPKSKDTGGELQGVTSDFT